MANIQRNFIRGRMNKSLDERLVPNGEYIDALNVRLGSTEDSEVGSVENSKGNTLLTNIEFENVSLSNNARCIGAFEDGANERIYWFVHDPAFTLGVTSKIDLILSYNTTNNSTTYHVISINDGSNLNTTLNFSVYNLITGVNLIDNLLFFTDNLNPPRFIDVDRTYTAPLSTIDTITANELLVIKAPPNKAPDISLINIVGQTDDFLEERFVSFAYRYKYANGEYSATSQFSKPAFVPGAYDFSYNSYLNEGMINTKNAVTISFNSGSSLVTGIELLFKESNTSQIKVIEALDKSNLGYANNTSYSFTFDDRKIFTLLPSSEILRLYDNVPLRAKAQSIMGNRLAYGNYYEGYDLKDKLNQDIRLEFISSLQADEIGNTLLTDTTGSGNYTIGPSPQTIPSSVIYLDFSKSDGTQIQLNAGAAISVDFRIAHHSFTGNTPSATTTNTSLTFDYVLPIAFNNVYSLATSTDFIEKVGTSSNIQTVTNSCNGQTLTDQFNCALPQTLGTYTKTASGITTTGEPIQIIATPNSNTIGFQMLAMQYVDGGNNAYEFYQVNFGDASFREIGNSESLHSNRGYEVGIVYMDDFLRSSTALVSPNNTVQVPCANSIDKNSIRVSIPTQQLAPSWATSYKFVLKPAESTYETIYSNIYYEDPDSNAAYFLLEGENAQKVTDGDRFFVKADSQGPVLRCVEATVLEKKAQSLNFIAVKDSAGNDISVPAGTYMKINPNNFQVSRDDNAIITEGSKSAAVNSAGSYPILAYPLNLPPPSGTGSYVDYNVPSGSRIVIKIRQERLGPGRGNGDCGRRINIIETELIASQTYDNMSEWFYGDNVATVFSEVAQTEVGGDEEPIVNTFETAKTGTTAPDLTSPSTDISTALGTNYYRTYRNSTTNELFLLVTGTKRCTGALSRAKRRSSVSVDIQIFRTDSVVIFESQPQDAAPDIWYENHLSFDIDSNGHHLGNIQDQTSSLPAIVDTEFFDCYSFGNGVESYKILDSIAGKSVNLGERVTTTTNQEYKEAHRFSDITYSGVYNDETNVNKLNEFNLGLLNFKTLEDSFGPIEILYGRRTDILVLQEDKISYVLLEKNLLSDATGGGAVTSVPEVLGTQIARIEEYGISNNPESFTVWGPNKYFTDAKRGAVINLVGVAGSNEQLVVISEAGMRGWFRDLFIQANQTNKLGGYDPYMNEYVFHSNVLMPLSTDTTDCIDCNTSKNLTILPLNTTTFCVNVGESLGIVDIDYTIPFEGYDNIITETSSNTITELNSSQIVTESASSGVGYVITAVYNGASFTTGTVYSSGTLSFNKNNVTASEVVINITQDSTTSDTIEIFTGCPQAAEMTIFNVAITSNADAGDTITNAYRWTDGTFSSPTHFTNPVTFSSNTVTPIVSQFETTSGPQGAGIIPGDGATVYIISTKNTSNTFNFDSTKNEFRYLRTANLYSSSGADINALLAASTKATPITSSTNPTQYESSFTMPAGGQFLYLIWDYRQSNSAELCYSSTSTTDACTGCSFSPTPVPTAPVPVVAVYTWRIEAGSGSATSPTSCPAASVALYSTASSFATTFTNSTLFYTDASLTTLFQGNDYYFGIREPNQGYGQSQGILRMTNSGTTSNIDTAGVCNPQPTPVPVPTAPTPVPAPVFTPPTAPCYTFTILNNGNPLDDDSYTYTACGGASVSGSVPYGDQLSVCAQAFTHQGVALTVTNTQNPCN
jgi:hypothetical protein